MTEGLPAKPCLRAVEAFPVDTAEGRLICLRDPMNVSQRIIGVPRPAFFLLTLMDGAHSLRDIRLAFTRRFGDILPPQDLEQLVADLDESLMLESDRFRSHLADLERAFREAPFRVPMHLGSGYDSEPDALGKTLEQFFLDPRGPKNIPQVAPRGSGKLAGVISPHIDYGRGGATYAWAWHEVATAGAADVYVILGTSHMPVEQFLSVSRKGFATPFGNLPADQGFIDLMEQKAGRSLETDVLVHRSEHSIELQTVWLSYLLRGHAVSIVPILCGSLSAHVEAGTDPSDDADIQVQLEALRQALLGCGKRVVLIAGADLAHVGTGFGDREPPDAAALRTVERGDRQTLSAALAGDADRFYRSIQCDGDCRRVCGLAPIYAMLRVMEARTGRLLRYEQCVDESGFRTVTIASAAFYT